MAMLAQHKNGESLRRTMTCSMLFGLISMHSFFSRKRSIEPKFRKPRLWSNRELRRFAPLFNGDIVNVSGWLDADKEGGHYKEYFSSASNYYLTNYPQDNNRGFQNIENEYALDLEMKIPPSLVDRFDVALCHTVLEHIYNVQKAFTNICLMTRGAVILIVPHLQQLHSVPHGVKDYWRFTPFSLQEMHKSNGLNLRYLSANGDATNSSIYLFSIGYRGNMYDNIIPHRFDIKIDSGKPESSSNAIGANIIK